VYLADSHIVNVLNYACFNDRLYVKLSQFTICWGIVQARYVKTAQRASLFGRIRHHFALKVSALYKAESDFSFFEAVYGYLFRKLLILIGHGTKFSIKKRTAVSYLALQAPSTVQQMTDILHPFPSEIPRVKTNRFPGVCWKGAIGTLAHLFNMIVTSHKLMCRMKVRYLRAMYTTSVSGALSTNQTAEKFLST
jgi:hypothetical protein